MYWELTDLSSHHVAHLYTCLPFGLKFFLILKFKGFSLNNFFHHASIYTVLPINKYTPKIFKLEKQISQDFIFLWNIIYSKWMLSIAKLNIIKTLIKNMNI